MAATYLHFAPDVSGLSALGAASFADLMDSEDLRGLEPAEPASDSADRACRTLRYPLPGTPDASGRLTGRPCGAGTGWVRLRRFRDAGLGEALRARLGKPRSLSLAEREWNLICHLRANGVGAPDPLAFGREGTGVFAKRSFLVTRELEGFRSVAEIAARETDPLVRRRVARAVGLCLTRLFRSETHLPGLDADHLLVSEARGPDERLAALGLSVVQLPEIVLTGLEGGRIGGPPTAAERESVLRSIQAGVGAHAHPRELLRVATLAGRDLLAAGRLGPR